jgi:AraC-like DNA-binding protein
MSTYRESAPPAPLAPYVVCVWEQRVAEVARSYEQPVFPDGFIDLVADITGAFVAGPATTAVIAAMPAGSVTVGVRLRRGAAPAVLGVSARELLDLNVSFDDLWGGDGAAAARRAGSAEPGERMAVLADFLGTLVDRDATVDVQVAAASALLAAEPSSSLDDLCDATGLSARQLRRRVADAVGYSPRLLAGVLRFQRFLGTVRAAAPDHRDLARIAVESGYADQSHLTRECRRFTGSTPVGLLTAEQRRLGGDGWPERSRPAAAARRTMSV